jgi:hypothetical protein
MRIRSWVYLVGLGMLGWALTDHSDRHKAAPNPVSTYAQPGPWRAAQPLGGVKTAAASVNNPSGAGEAVTLAKPVVDPSRSAASSWAYIKASSLRVRGEPGKSSRQVGSLVRGTRVEVVGHSGDWVRIRDPGTQVTGWAYREYVRSDGTAAIQAPKAPAVASPGPSDGAIRRALIEQSIAGYPGSCPCPYAADRAGRSCGRRSAYSRAGGYSPLCYPQDVTQAMIENYRQTLR